MTPALSRLQSLVLHPDRRIGALTVAALCATAALVVGVYTALLGPLFAFAGAVGLAAGLLMLRSLRWGFAVFIGIAMLLPFATLPFKIGVTPTFLDLALVAIYLVWAMRIVTGRQRRLAGSSLGLFVMAFLAMALFAFAAGMSHANPTSTTLRRFAEIVLSILLFFVAVDFAQEEDNLTWLVRVILLAGFGASLVAIVLYVIPDALGNRILSSLGRFGYPTGNVLRYIEDDPANPMRAIGTSVDPNVLGGLLIFIGTLAAAQIFVHKPILPRLLVAATLASAGLALYLTYSRGSMAGLALALLFLAAVKYRRLLVVLIFAGALLMFLPPAQEYVSHFIEGVGLRDRAMQMRVGEFRDAFILIGRYPWFGVGFTGTPDIDTYVGVSNVYLLMAEQMGLVGLAVFLVTMSAYFLLLARRWLRGGLGPQREAILLGLSSAVVGVLGGGLGDHYLFNLVYPHMAALFWLYVGMAAAIMGRRPALTHPLAPSLSQNWEREG
ncbi:MAG: O-antigen ligase family protein [Anaerolineae bacterium]|nr:O-antigen ligase family protein [Anaerolineae bacterium]